MKIGVIGAVIENPQTAQDRFNREVGCFADMIKGRMGLPFPDQDIAVVAITVVGSLDRINHLTGVLGNLPGVTVKTAISPKKTPWTENQP